MHPAVLAPRWESDVSRGTCIRRYLRPKYCKYIYNYLTLGALCTAAWCSGSESVPSEIAEPTYGAQSFGCAFIKALQSKDFSEILLICVNFLVIAHGSIYFPRQNGCFILGHKKYFGLISVFGMGSLSISLHTSRLFIPKQGSLSRDNQLP